MKYCIKAKYVNQILEYYHKKYLKEYLPWDDFSRADKTYFRSADQKQAIIIEREYVNRPTSRVFVTISDENGRIQNVDVWRLVSESKAVPFSHNKRSSEICDIEILESMEQQIEELEERNKALLKLLKKERGKYSQPMRKENQGRKNKFDSETQKVIQDLVNSGTSITEVARQFGVTRKTIYRYLRS